MLTRPIRNSLIFSALMLGVLANLHLGLSLNLESNARRLSQPSRYVLPSADTIAIAALNHRAAAADVVWVNALLYGADRFTRRQSAEDATDYANTIIDLDPRFKSVYMWHHATRTQSSSRVTYDDIAAANAILKRGLEAFPDEWKFAQAIVTNHIGQRYTRTPEEHLADMEEAYTYARLGSEMEGAPDDMMMLATSFQRRLAKARAAVNGDDPDESQLEASPAEIAYLMKGYFAATDPARQQFMLRQLYDLGAGAELVARIETYRQTFEREHQRRAYLPPDVFTLSEPGLYRAPGTLEAAGEF
ncbi:hypothetical protein DV096_06780 [Bradymonadaceae bacterium TMQ3]|nr:hypothetical protein DV096_06780 [Bradymonadaceae bacterium TMQ3]TXC76714.1 hypothetical protein FRC91_08285 [Bradymonadales bacterium TMQ1]